MGTFTKMEVSNLNHAAFDLHLPQTIDKLCCLILYLRYQVAILVQSDVYHRMAQPERNDYSRHAMVLPAIPFSLAFFDVEYF
jgi:hypothetical protein